MRLRGPGKRLWAVMLNICTRQAEHPSTKSCRLLSHTCVFGLMLKQGVEKGGGTDEDKIIFVSCLSVECYDLWCQSGASWGVRAHFQRHLSCGYGSLLCLRCSCLHHAPWHPTSPSSSSPPSTDGPGTVHLWSLALFPSVKTIRHPPAHLLFIGGPACLRRLERIKRWHKRGLALALNTGRLGDLKGRGENYRKWSVTEIKNHHRLPPITLNNAVENICWSDAALALSVEKNTVSGGCQERIHSGRQQQQQRQQQHGRDDSVWSFQHL